MKHQRSVELAEGLPEEAIGELANKAQGEVSGYCIKTCYYYTEIIADEINCSWYTA